MRVFSWAGIALVIGFVITIAADNLVPAATRHHLRITPAGQLQRSESCQIWLTHEGWEVVHAKGAGWKRDTNTWMWPCARDAKPQSLDLALTLRDPSAPPPRFLLSRWSGIVQWQVDDDAPRAQSLFAETPGTVPIHFPGSTLWLRAAIVALLVLFATRMISWLRWPLTKLTERVHERERGYLPLIAFAAVALILYAPVYLNNYAFSDDYFLLWQLEKKGLAETMEAMGEFGAPVRALLLNLAFAAAGGIDGLSAVRLLSVLAIATLGFLLFRALRDAKWSGIDAALVAAILIGLPSFQISAFWSELLPNVLAALLGGLGATLGRLAWADTSGSRIPKLVGAVTSLAAALCVEPYAASVFWLFALIHVLRSETRSARAFAVDAGRWLTLFCVTWAAAAIAIAPLTPRVTNLSAKAAWFVASPLRDAWNLGFEQSGIRAGVIAVGALVGIACYGRRHVGMMTLPLVTSAVIVVLAFFPSLARAENFSAYRTQIALGAMCALLCAIAVRGLIGDRPQLITRSFAAWAVLALVSAGTHVSRDLVQPQARELALWRSRARLVTDPKDICLSLGKREHTIARIARYDEVGVTSFSIPWVSPSIVALLLIENGARAVEVGASPTCATAARGALVFDGALLAELH